MKTISFRSWLDWSSWLLGIRVDWAPYRRFIVMELGPVGLSWEYDPDEDTEAKP